MNSQDKEVIIARLLRTPKGRLALARAMGGKRYEVGIGELVIYNREKIKGETR